jgi:hypothetical protein
VFDAQCASSARAARHEGTMGFMAKNLQRKKGRWYLRCDRRRDCAPNPPVGRGRSDARPTAAGNP